MQVITIQGYDLRSFCGPVDLVQGTYRNSPSIVSAQHRVHEAIGTDQVIWCCRDVPYLFGEVGRYLHEVTLARADVVAVVDSFIWTHIIEPRSRYVPQKEHEELRRCVSLSDAHDPDQAIREAENKYLHEHLPADLWSRVLKTDANRTDDQILVRFPFVGPLINKVEKVTDEIPQAVLDKQRGISPRRTARKPRATGPARIPPVKWPGR